MNQKVFGKNYDNVTNEGEIIDAMTNILQYLEN